MPGVIVERISKRSPRSNTNDLAIFVSGPAEWGPFDPTIVTSVNDFENKFGSPIAASWAYQGIKQFFDERGVGEVWFNRIAHYTDVTTPSTITAVKASITIQDRAAVPVDTLKVEALYAGELGNQISVIINNATVDSANKFKVTVKLKNSIVETFDELSMDITSDDYVEKKINGFSSYINVTDLDSTTQIPSRNPAIGTYVLTNGDNGITGLTDDDWIGNSTAKTGIYKFDFVKNRRFIMIAPGQTSRKVIKAMADYCYNRQVGYCIAQAPYGVSDKVAVDFKNGTGSYSSDNIGGLWYNELSIYHPWGYGKILTQNVFGPVSVEGAIAANHSKTQYRRGVAKAPAGLEDGYISNLSILGVASAVDADYLNSNGICPIVNFDNFGTVLWGARTTSTDSNYDQIQITTTVQWFTQWCYDNLLKYTFEPIISSTFDKITIDALKVLSDKYAQGWFDDGGTGDPNEAYYFQCDYGNNTPETIANRNIIIDFGVRPPGAAEIIKVRLSLYSGTSS
ncbi:phage tail sheath N-terminal beta-sandwich domain-containing protein [Thermosipho sp. (in: thermotogales)]|jgi:hypothetical protein|uniref:phage tail sheath N-terminal beta-sandwich domain-containing protein n=1 Tax=Thermosipho sp. (in: thermotogales) TaxID=1968895 RepID=UPI00257C58F1|nr:phage tail sheath N-terminal beta-sandwich domain-containing protein [Thermosipho sp. (in: thermotogales)]MBZ4649181.1 Phage tail sheath protein [Thermosipho sp. (in: thermotogales)]